MKRRFGITGFKNINDANNVYNNLKYIIEALTFTDGVMFCIKGDPYTESYYIDGLIPDEHSDIVGLFQQVYSTNH